MKSHKGFCFVTKNTEFALSKKYKVHKKLIKEKHVVKVKSFTFNPKTGLLCVRFFSKMFHK